MKISCPNCAAAYELDEGRVPPAGLSIKCPKCKTPFTVHRPKAGDTGPVVGKPAAAAPRAGPGAVALPGTPGAKPPARSAAPKTSMPAAGVVPLPGSPAEGGRVVEARPPPARAPAPAPAPAASAVPLPGLDDGFEPPPVPAPSRPPPARVPLPGDAAAARPPTGPIAAPAPAEDDPFSNLDLGSAAPPPPAASALDDAFPVDIPPPAPAPSAPSGDDDFRVDLGETTPPPPGRGAPDPDTALMPRDETVDPESALIPRERAPAPTSRPDAGGDLLDFVDDAPRPTPSSAAKAKRPPPPMLGKAADAPPPAAKPDEDLPLETEGAAAAPAATDAKKAEKERKKKERAERAQRDREERARRRAEAGPGLLQSRVLPALREGAATLREPRKAVAAVAAAVLLVFLALGLHAGRTPAGLFWMNHILPGKRAATAAEAKVIQGGLQKLGEGDFVSAREAVGTAAQLLSTLPEDEDVRAFFILATSELKIAYGQVGADWDKAKTVLERMKAQRPNQNRARGAFALASGDVPRAKSLLQPLGDGPNADLESVWLYAQSLVRGNEAAHGAQLLDNALKGKNAGAVKLLLLRGEVAEQKGQLADAQAAFDKALAQRPQSGSALIGMADVKLRQGDLQAANDLLAKVLDEPVRKTLDAREEGRANMLKGRLAVATHDAKGAEASFDRAATLDPSAPEIREAYGEFRLARREWEKAGKQFEEAIATGNAAPSAYAGAARADLGMNKLVEADKRINEAVGKDPQNAHYIYLQGRVAEAIGKGEEALKDYDRALARKGDLAEALAAQGMMYLSRGDKARAQDRLQAALKVPDASRTSLEEQAIGDLSLALGDKDRARDAWAHALQKDPDDPLAHAGLGKALAAQGDLKAARKELETALAQVDSDPSLWFEYGSLLRRMNESDGALEALRKAVKLDSKEPRYRSRLGALLVERGQFEEAEQQLRQAVLMNDKYAEAQFFLGRALLGRKSLTDAADTLKKAVEIDPDNPDAYYWLGLTYEAGQQVQDAVESFQHAIDKLAAKNVGGSAAADAYEHLGLNLMVENRFAEAVTAFKKGAELDTARPRLWAEVGDAEQQSGDLDGAIRDLQRAVTHDPNLPGAWTKLGIAYKDKDCRGCRARALDALKHATRVDPTDARAHHELGYMYKDDGRRAEAIAEFRRYLELKPSADDKSTVQDDIFYLQEESRRTP